ncbi:MULTISPECIES: hypothetical protein [Staphylococcus]|jgi:hypothetical protein|uniref:hypothetical protein n=1 Tax=Staphylococcus TaxID=1279 RepID=UPI001642B5CC|nr:MULTISPECIES: hypothetical protein [Staphylococcus]MBC2921943.1 hypothetical protein [Staphylococcus saprophyticus]MBC2958534.1 hypothetical protein [Staphylococcus saprophyticus]MBC3010383.1 hypothetical protein [Staphylococcus saprophyticus]MBC3024262.1 hypothetical protein [Staphylococcus saprophyticus]MBC3031489.1 hypothetical protein [Staphylococcus saprophyticus]
MINIENLKASESYLKICKDIKEYEMIEFERDYNEDEEVFDSNLKCDLAYTTKGDDEEFEIQVSLDLKNNRLIRELSHLYDNYIEYDYFDSWNDIALMTEYLNFDDLIMTDVDVDELQDTFNKNQAKY